MNPRPITSPPTPRTRTQSRQPQQSQPHHHTSPKPVSNLSLSRPTSQPGHRRNSSRGDLPSRPAPAMAEPTTPTPKKPGRRKKGVPRSAQRARPDGSGAEIADGPEPSSEDEEELFGLLGVVSPPQNPVGVNGKAGGAASGLGKGLLPVSKADIDQANLAPSKKGGRRKKEAVEPGQISGAEGMSSNPKPRQGRRQGNGTGQEDRAAVSEGEVVQSKGRRNRQQVSRDGDINSGSIAQPEPVHPASTIAESLIVDSAFDVSSMSQSLPAENFFAPSSGRPKGAGSKGSKASKATVAGDESAVWEMPDGGGAQELTWQQKLGSYPNADGSTPKRKAKAKSRVASGHAPSPLNPNIAPNVFQPAVGIATAPPSQRPSHARRASADGITATSAPATRSFSAFDNMMPFHTGMNVHRAPQTPAKMASNVAPGPLPIVPGEFPRLNQGSKGVFGANAAPPGGPKYAGPTFHNSPHASSLPKPDLEDF